MQRSYNRRMPSRVLTFFLAFVLMWSGLSPAEPWHAPDGVGGAPTAQAEQPEPGILLNGTLYSHHLDEQPYQVQGDAFPDLKIARCGAFPLVDLGPAPAPRAGLPDRYDSPCLEGLLRPPAA